MAPQHKQKHVTRNQRKQAEKSFNITDYINGFRVACLNRAKDIRDFANECDSVALDEDKWENLKELTHMLTEQLAFLQDAWNTMMRLVKEHEIDIETDDAYKAIEHSRAHALKVATMAFQIADTFVLSQEGYQIGEDEEATTNVNETVEERVTETRRSDEAPPEMQAESIRSTKQTEREKANQDKTTKKGSAGVVVHSGLKEKTEEDIDESSEDGATHREERTAEITSCATASKIEQAYHDASKTGAEERKRATSHSDEHETQITGGAMPESPDE